MNYYNCHQEELLLFYIAPIRNILTSERMDRIQTRQSDQWVHSIGFQYSITVFGIHRLKNSLLNVKLRLTRGDGTPLTEEEVAGLVNLPLQPIFRQVDVTFQQTQVSHTGTNYPYKAYIDTILKTNQSTQQNLLFSQLFNKDVGKDSNDAQTGGNTGLFNRYWATRGGKIVDFEGPLFINLFQQPRLLVNGVSIGIKL